ncbi:MAG: MBL fold metallo-hydrolase [Thermoplasmata archaeon]
MTLYEKSGYINAHLLMLDVFGWNNEKTTSSFIVKGDKVAIMDPGGKSSGEKIVEKLNEYRIDPDSVTHIFVSHRHNDHAGGAPPILKTCKNAKVYASSITLENLANPDKINNATISLYGDLAEPIDAVKEKERLVPISDGDTFNLGNDVMIKAIYAPGHTSDHFMFLELNSKFLFTGDGAGLFSGKYSTLLPNSFPPSFRFENYLMSMKNILNLNFDIVGFSHYGALSGPDARKTIVEGLRILNEWNSVIREKGSASEEILLKKYIAQFDLFPQYFRIPVFKIIVNGFSKNL